MIEYWFSLDLVDLENWTKSCTVGIFYLVRGIFIAI